MSFDRRTTPARADLAAAHLQGKVTAARFAPGRPMYVARGTVALRAEPADDAAMDTQLLLGERFTVYDEGGGWSWGQAEQDSYVGYARTDALIADAPMPTHRVTALATPLLPAPSVLRSPRDMLPMNAKVAVAGAEKAFARIGTGDYVAITHLAPLGYRAPDWVAAAERFIGAPYVWGGKIWAGIDCSGLVQTSLEAAGIFAPRDADMMERGLGAAIAHDDHSQLRRGDIVFWNDHVGVMLDAARFLHANSFHMQVTVEPFAEVVERILARGERVTSIRRL